MEGGVRKENCESTLHRPPPHPRYATVYPFPFTTSVLWLRETELAATAAATTAAAGAQQQHCRSPPLHCRAFQILIYQPSI